MLGRLFRNAVRDPKWGQWGSAADLNDLGANTSSGQRVTQDSALRQLTVYGCVTKIAETIGTMPVDQYRKVGDQRRDVTPRASWLDRPNTDTDWIAFATQIVSSWLLAGHAFVAPIRNPFGAVTEVYALDPVVTDVQRVDGKVQVVQNGRPYPGEVVHGPAFIKAGALRGVNPVEHARESIGLEMAAEAHGASFFRNGTTLSGVLEFPGDLDDSQIKVLRANWLRHHQGGSKAYLPGVVTGGGSFKPVAISMRDSQFLESRQFEAAHIASMMFKIDPSMFGLSQPGQSLTYQNIDQRWMEFIRAACSPWIARFELLMSSLLPRPQYLKLNYDAFVRADIKTRYEAHEIALQNHWQTIPETRALEDMPPLDNGELFPPSKTPPKITGSAG